MGQPKSYVYFLFYFWIKPLKNFYMNLFLIPNDVCESIEVRMNGFWWGHGVENKVIRWKSWKNSVFIKEDGGLGFRRLKNFNIVMLAKQGWRLINNDNPLVTACMKVKYFFSGNFLTVKLGANPGYVWRSILAVQEIMRKGCIRRIGNGRQMDIWIIMLLPCAENYV